MVETAKGGILMCFAENLMRLRRQQGWSQEELGSKIGVTRQTISKWEVGQSTPELEKLMELSRLFHISIDRLVGIEEQTEQIAPWEIPNKSPTIRSYGVFYEYVSPVKVFGLPLIHIRWGLGPQLAKGIIAIGNFSVGVVSIGGCSLGVFSLGGVGIGLLFALGGVSLGLAALGGLAVGGFAVGGCAVGQWLAIGGGALSNYLAIGGAAISRGVAIGGSARGHIAVGVNGATGWFPFLSGSGYTIEEIWELVKAEFPHMWGWVRNVIQWISR